MPIAQIYTGTATIGTTEYSIPSASTTLSSISVPAIYQVFLDLSNMTATESYRIRIKEKVRVGATQRNVHDVILSGAQVEPLYASPSLLLINGWDVTLVKVSGTDRVIEFSIRKVS